MIAIAIVFGLTLWLALYSVMWLATSRTFEDVLTGLTGVVVFGALAVCSGIVAVMA